MAPDFRKIKYPKHRNKTFLRIDDYIDEEGKIKKGLPPFIPLTEDKTMPVAWAEWLAEGGGEPEE